MAPYYIRTYQERDRKPVVDLYCRGVIEHVSATFRHILMLPRTLLLEVGVLVSVFLVSGSWLLAIMSSLTLLLFFWFLARYMWKQVIVTSLCTDMADITKSYMNICDSCFWVAESGGQVAGIVCARPLENSSLMKKQLQLFHLTVTMEHRGEGIAKALVRTVLQFARDHGYDEILLDSTMMHHSALALYQGMGFQKTDKFFKAVVWKLTDIPWFYLTYHLPSAQDGGL